MVATPDFKVGAKSKMRLEASSDLVKFYKTVGGDITNTMIKWDPIIKDFNPVRKILANSKRNYVLEIPKIIKALPFIKWMEYFANFIHGNVDKKKYPVIICH